MGKKHTPLTTAQLESVVSMIQCGVSVDVVAKGLGIDNKTFLKHYRGQIDKALSERHAEVNQSLFQSIKKGDVTATIFYLKTQCRWKDKDLYKLKKLEVDIKKQAAQAAEVAATKEKTSTVTVNVRRQQKDD